MGRYECVCGKEFDYYKSFNAHRSSCKTYLGDDKYDKAVYARNKKRKIEAIKNADKKVKDFLATSPVCECCNRPLKSLFGSGRFCNRSCANKWVALNQSDDARRRKVEAGIKNLLRDSEGIKKSWTPERKAKARGRTLSGETRRKISEGLTRYYSDEVNAPTELTRLKISNGVKRAIINGKRPGYLSLKRSESYPEAYWTNVLLNLGIPFEREYKIKKCELDINETGCYFLDFLLPGKVNLEIDGSQHEKSAQRESDKKRDKLLHDNGYKVYRVKWKNPRTDQSAIVEDIDQFFSWYSSL